MKYFFVVISLLLICGKNADCQTGLEIYKVRYSPAAPTDDKERECHFCFDPQIKDLYDKPLLDETDIVKFEWENQRIIINEKGKEKLKILDIPLKGLAVAIVLNKEIIYGFWFWNQFSSIGCDRVFTWPLVDFKIRFGLPGINFVYGDDPRFNPKLKAYVMDKYYKND